MIENQGYRIKELTLGNVYFSKNMKKLESCQKMLEDYSWAIFFSFFFLAF